MSLPGRDTSKEYRLVQQVPSSRCPEETEEARQKDQRIKQKERTLKWLTH
jgi:hypothetical protein